MILKPMALATFKVKALRFKAQPYSMSNRQSSLSNYSRKFNGVHPILALRRFEPMPTIPALRDE